MKTLNELKELVKQYSSLKFGPITYTTTNEKYADDFKQYFAYADETLASLPLLIDEVERLREVLTKIIIPIGATVSKEELQISSYALRTLAESKERLP